MGSIIDFSKNTTIKSGEIPQTSWVLDLEDIEKDTGILLQKKLMKNVNSKSDKHIFYRGNVLYSKLRPYLNKVIIADENGFCTTEILAFNFGEICNKYAQIYLMSPFFVDYAMSDAYGVKMPRIGSEQGNRALMPIPPINEQYRIVAKLEETQLLIDKYRVVYEQSQEIENTLQGTLKKSILQYAIQGKLVPQIDKEEPASVLLEKIQQEKQKLVKEGKLKKKDLTESTIFKGDDNKYYEKVGNEITCIDDELPFEIPDNWSWTRMGNIGVWGAGSTPQRSNSEYYNNGTIPWLKTGELNDSIVYDTSEKITEKAFKECSLRLNKVGDILIAMYGATIGKIAIVGNELTTNQACCGCTPFEGIYNLYLFYYLMANKQTFIKQGEGGAQPNISRDKLIKFLIPIPPKQEQKRIVERLDNILKGIEGI